MKSHLSITDDYLSIYVLKNLPQKLIHYTTQLFFTSSPIVQHQKSDNLQATSKILCCDPSNPWKICWSSKKKINNTITSKDYVLINKLNVLLTTCMIKVERMIKKYGPQFPWSPTLVISIIELDILKLIKSTLKTNNSRDINPIINTI